MKTLISSFGDHLKDALSRIASYSFDFKGSNEFSNVVISGLGGSGISGTIISELIAPVANVPVWINKDYGLPAFVNEKTLVVACSYSGNTEETLSAAKIALSKGAKVVCITSGGELLKIAGENRLNVLTMQGGNPPRSMLGYSFIYLCYLMKNYGVADFQYSLGVDEFLQLLKKEEAEIKEKAENLAKRLKGKIPVIYAVSGSLGIATRWRQQFNENAKMLAWEAEIPEMNHNELVGWEGGNTDYATIFLRNSTDFERSSRRIEIIKEIIGKKTENINEVWSKGESAVARTLYLIHFGDWVSYYLSKINGVDIMDIRSIDHLKSELSKISDFGSGNSE